MITVINEFEKIANLVYPGKKDCRALELLQNVIRDKELLKSYIPAQGDEITIITLHKSK